MQTPDIAARIAKVVGKNSPAILTSIGVTGTITTAALTARAAFQVGKDVNAGHYEPLMEGQEPEVYEFKDLVRTYWKEFVPPALTGLATVACIVGANNISSKRNAVLISAYSLSEKVHHEYKDKVLEQIGANKEQKIRDEIAQDQVLKNPVAQEKIFVTGKGDTLCYESYTGRYFYCDVETIRQAQNTINDEILHNNCASLNEFNDLLGLSPTQIGDEMGWTVDRLLKVQFSSILNEDQTPCLSIGYELTPVRDFYKLR